MTEPTTAAPTSPVALAKLLFGVLKADRPRLENIDNYLHGIHDGPYMPDHADAEYRLLATRCVSNWMPLLVGTPAQALYVDGFRRRNDGVKAGELAPEWKHWQRSRLDARQLAVHRGALTYGHSFTLTEKVAKGVITRGLSALTTAALFEDPANDDTPYAAMHVDRWPKGEKGIGKARLWDGRLLYAVTWKTDEAPTVAKGTPHGSVECPITRFAAQVDLDGRTLGVVEPMIPLNDRINQTVFDLLVAQTYGSFKVRTVTGMAPPMKLTPINEIVNGVPTTNIIDWEPEIDPTTGRNIPASMPSNASRWQFAEDPNVKFGTLDETPLGGYIESIDMSIRHLAAVSQTPPHHLLGQIANLSAEALTAAEVSLSRKIAEFRSTFGESWERVFRLAAELEGNAINADDFTGEVMWRDMESRSLAQAADALGKMREQLGIPARGLWERVPGVTQTEIETWELYREDEDSQGQLASALTRATTSFPEMTDDDARPTG